MPGRDFTLCRQFYTARKLTESHGIMSKVEIDFKILEILLLWWKLMYEILEHLYYCFCLFVCLFVCFCYQIREITRYFLNRPNGMVSLSFIFYFFFLLKQIQWFAEIVVTVLVDSSLDNSAISFSSSGAWPGFLKRDGVGGGGEGGSHCVKWRVLARLPCRPFLNMV